MGAPSRPGRTGDAPPSDALVVFGFTGDLANKKIIPALYAMAKKGALTVPVIGVASSAWSADQVRERVRTSLEREGRIDDASAFDRLLSLLRYVSGDYKDPATFSALKAALGHARHAAHYLAIPPPLLPTEIQSQGASVLAEGARDID